MTAGQTVKYSSSWACFKEVVRTEGGKALFRGAGVNIVRGVAGAGVLSGFDRLKKVYISRRDVMWASTAKLYRIYRNYCETWPDWPEIDNQIFEF